MRRSDAGCASGSFFGGCWRGSTAPGAASAARAGVRFSFAGRSAVPRRGRSGPALLRVAPKDAVAVPSLAATPACLATWAGGLLFGADGIAGLRFRYARGCLPRPRDRLGRRDRSGFDQGLLLSRRAPRVSEGLAKPPHCRALRFAPVAPHGARGESVPDAGASPRRLRNALASRKRHLGVGNHQL